MAVEGVDDVKAVVGGVSEVEAEGEKTGAKTFLVHAGNFILEVLLESVVGCKGQRKEGDLLNKGGSREENKGWEKNALVSYTLPEQCPSTPPSLFIWFVQFTFWQKLSPF